MDVEVDHTAHLARILLLRRMAGNRATAREIMRTPVNVAESPAWPADFLTWLGGEGCPYCNDERPDEIAIGSRFYSSQHGDGYLLNDKRCFGSAVMIWRGRHVTEPTQLEAAEAAAYWRDLMTAARAVESRYQPLKVNYFTHGNHVPHLHTVLLLRFAEGDPSPGNTILWTRGNPQDRATLESEVEALRELVEPR
jgi:diadenosine tetraphosphate (Ap4A) HIT family hydrolase